MTKKSTVKKLSTTSILSIAFSCALPAHAVNIAMKCEFKLNDPFASTKGAKSYTYEIKHTPKASKPVTCLRLMAKSGPKPKSFVASLKNKPMVPQNYSAPDVERLNIIPDHYDDRRLSMQVCLISGEVTDEKGKTFTGTKIGLRAERYVYSKPFVPSKDRTESFWNEDKQTIHNFDHLIKVNETDELQGFNLASYGIFRDSISATENAQKTFVYRFFPRKRHPWTKPIPVTVKLSCNPNG